ncbi:MAG: hypothetical protein ACFE9D_00425 [Promethearchaeota archaeon]
MKWHLNKIQALTTAHEVNPQQFTILGKRGLTEAAAKRIAQNTSVI